jgi:hypothetical protein
MATSSSRSGVAIMSIWSGTIWIPRHFQFDHLAAFDAIIAAL